MSTLDIDIGWAAGAIERVELRSHRPDTSRVLPGRTPDEALALLGRLYTVCGRAQRAAAEFALGAALGRSPTVERRAELLRACAIEAVQEHLWRLLVDWPRALGLLPAQERFAHWYRRCGADDADWPSALLEEIERSWIGRPADALAEWSDPAAWDAWLEDRGPALAALFAELRAAPAARRDAGARTARTPRVAETGAVVQHAEHPCIAGLLAAGRGVEARAVARLVGLATLAGNLCGRGDRDLETEFDAGSRGPGRATAVVTTARGLLVHDVALADERIASYSIRTPTDANFAADGAYVAQVRGRTAADAAEAVRIAELWALALDPCVPYAVRLAEADHA